MLLVLLIQNILDPNSNHKIYIFMKNKIKCSNRRKNKTFNKIYVSLKLKLIIFSDVICKYSKQ